MSSTLTWWNVPSLLCRKVQIDPCRSGTVCSLTADLVAPKPARGIRKRDGAIVLDS